METQELTAAPPPVSIWKSIGEALRGSHQDFTTGSLNRAILLLAIPMVLEMVLESLFAVVDVFWVGRLGADAVATVGLTESLLSLVFAVGLGLSLSTTAMVARRIGEKDPAGAAVAGVQAIVIGIAISLLVGVPCAFLAPRLLGLMGASPQIIAVGSGYARIALGGSGAIMLLFLNNAIFRGAGDAAIAMRLLWVSNIINLVLDPCLIFGWGPFPKLGVTGAALATLTGRSIGVLYQFYRVGADCEPVRLRGAGRIHNCDSHSYFHHPAELGTEQRGRHTGGPKSGRKTTAASGNVRVAYRLLQHAIPGDHRCDLHLFCGAGSPAIHERSGSSAIGGVLPAHSELREYWIRVRYGHAASFQWRRRYGDSDDCLLFRFLVAGDSLGV